MTVFAGRNYQLTWEERREGDGWEEEGREDTGDCTVSLYSLYNPEMVVGGGWWRIILDSQLHQHIPTLRYSDTQYTIERSRSFIQILFSTIFTVVNNSNVWSIIIVVQSVAGNSSDLTHIIRCEAKPSVLYFRLQRMARKEGFYRVELIKTVWEVPERYQNLMPVGHGAFGQVEHRDLTREHSTHSVILGLFCHRHRAEISRWLRGMNITVTSLAW